MNPIMLSWREDYKFFEQNFVKLKNIHDYVDVQNSSKQKEIVDKLLEDELKRINLERESEKQTNENSNI